ncbi:lambda Rz1-like protein [Klebsiella phage N1M2]|uniref:Lambda Rz1-like protein n=1 Tax=Klebsiella phage N1M2 TaxID=2664939 RepID=A0A6B7ZES7_9CAUD|nr:lambda Rz1-like protein [Klebsiella phage N1M2]QGH71976.1 lambda Rz1-like protein [Klebsiella phage N1M2]
MNDALKNKLAALNTIALWILVLFIGGWLIFKQDSTVSKDTIDKLTIAVDRISVTAENMTKTANAQREWTENLQKSTYANNLKREGDYENLYEKYGYDPKRDSGTLSDLYDLRLRRSENIGSGDVRGSEDGTSKTNPVQKPASSSKAGTN